VSGDGLDGLRKAQTALPDVVLLDLNLPGMNGLDVCRELRAGERTRDIPIIMITAKTEETDQVVGTRSGPTTTSASRSPTRSCLHKVKALLRRVQGQGEPGDVSEAGGVKIDRVRHRVHVRRRAARPHARPSSASWSASCGSRAGRSPASS
jgi:two-component system phosphate regulon response regulator PhoB